MVRSAETERDRAYYGFVELVERAKATGELRADFVPEDLVLLLMATAGVINATGDTAPDAWKRLRAYCLRPGAAPPGRGGGRGAGQSGGQCPLTVFEVPVRVRIRLACRCMSEAACPKPMKSAGPRHNLRLSSTQGRCGAYA